MKALLWLAFSLPLTAQQLTFAPQTIAGKRSPMQLWAVSGVLPVGSRPPSAAVVYGIALRHGVSFIDGGVALSRLTARERRSLAARIFTWGTYFETGAAQLVNLHVIAANPQITAGLNIAMGIVTSILPLVQKEIPSPDAGLVAKFTSGSLFMDAEGAVSGLFWAEPSGIPGFQDALP